MSVLTTKKREGLRASVFGIPKTRSYPMPDKAHAANAKARATQMYNRGGLSAGARARINAKASKILDG